MAEALAEDPTVYEYDSIYDQLQEQKKKTNAKLQGKKDTKVYIKVYRIPVYFGGGNNFQNMWLVETNLAF